MRILGIDLGSKSIKAVEVDSAFGRYEIRDYHEIPIDPGIEPAQTLNQFIQNLPKKPDRVAMAMRTGNVTFRNFQLPARGKKAIQAAIGFELEDELPFSLEQAAYDYSLVHQTKQSTEVHVAATLKRHVAAFLDTCQSAHVDPDLLTTEAWGFRAILNRITAKEDGKPVLLVHLGHERTVLYGHHSGVPILAREVSWGGRDLTAAICRKYGIPLDQAETAKLDHGFVIPESQRKDATQEQLQFSDTLQEPLMILLRELHQALLSCKNAARQHVSQIYISGGSSLLPGLSRLFEESLNTPVRPLQALSSVSLSGVAYSEQTDALFALAVSSALCLVGPDRSISINFRKADFAKQARSREFNMDTWRRLLMASGAVLACFFGSLIVQSQVYKTQLTDVDIQLEKNVKSFFGGLSGSAVKTYMASTSTLRNSVNKELTKQRDVAKLLGPNPHSPLEFLKEVSSTVPKDVVVDLIQFQVGSAPTAPYSATADTTASFAFLVSNPQVAERLATLLSSKISGLQRGKMEETTASDGTKKWKITFTGKPSEDAYGK